MCQICFVLLSMMMACIIELSKHTWKLTDFTVYIIEPVHRMAVGPLGETNPNTFCDEWM